MICYRDMTFCGYYSTCANGKTCHRALTPEVEKRATEWWGKKNPPICIFAEKPDCYSEEVK